MIKLNKPVYFLTILCGLCACATSTSPVNNPEPSADIIQVEPHKGRLTVETSVARTVKYNFDAVKKQTADKFLGSQAKIDAFSNLMKLRQENHQTLSSSLKELDFAILYTTLNHAPTNDLADNLLNQTVHRHLVAGAIKAHKNTLYSHKKIFEIRRKIRQYQKQILSLIKKQNAGTATSSDIAQKDTLENNINEFNRILQTMEQNISDFKLLVKIDSKKLELEGRRFFDNTKLPPQSTPHPYLALGFATRPDFEGFSRHSLEEIADQIEPKNALDNRQVSGFYIQDQAQEQNLISSADAQAAKLLQTALNYQKASPSKKTRLEPKLAEELHKAVYLQIKTAYQLAVKTSADMDIQQTTVKELEQQIRQLEKVSRPTPKQQEELLDKRLELLKNENIADEILAEKTLAIIALRFYTAQMNITPDLLGKNISELSSYYAKHLNEKLPTSSSVSITATQTPIEQISTSEGNSWAHEENWLENLIKQNPKPLPPKPTDAVPSKTSSFDSKTILQLGAFLDKPTAEQEWQTTLKEFPELAKYTPLYEQTYVAGISLTRLLIKSPSGGLKNICISLRQKGKECILKD